MSDAAVYPVPNGEGAFFAEVCETVVVSQDPPSYLRVVQQADGWRCGFAVVLPEDAVESLPCVDDDALSTRSAALDLGREDLVRWLSDQKLMHGKKHRAAAELAQNAALAMAFVQDAEWSRVAVLPMGSVPAGDLVPRLVALDELIEAPENPRGELVEVGLEELVESMRQSGFRPWLPIVARVLDAGGGMIAAGHRRSRAARLAGLTEVPCVLKPMTDEEFLDILNFDNGGREGVHPLYEAAGWRNWMARTGRGVIDIAARIGKSKEYVYARLKLDDGLIPEAKRAFVEGKFKAEHAVAIARRPEKVQQAALKFLEPKWKGSPTPSTRALEEWLHGEQSKDLAEALFDRADGSLVAGAPLCGTCPRLQANDPAFVLLPATEDDHSDDLERRPQDCCLDPLCFRQKTDNHLARVRAQIQEDTGKDVVLVSSSYSTKKKGALTKNQYEVVKSGGVPALVVDGFGVGEAIHVRVKREPPKESKEAAEERKKVESAAALELAATRKRELAIRERILDAVLVAAGGSMGRAELQGMLAALFGNPHGLHYSGEWLCGRRGVKCTGWNTLAALAGALPKLRDAEITALAIELSVAREFEAGNLDGPAEALMGLAKRYKVDAAKIRSAVEGEAGVEKPKKVAGKKKAAAKKKAPAKTNRLSPAARARIAAAQKRRWAEHRKKAAAAAKGGKA